MEKRLYIMPQIKVATIEGCSRIMTTSIGLPPDMAPQRRTDVF
jgi:hypothetical protein